MTSRALGFALLVACACGDQAAEREPNACDGSVCSVEPVAAVEQVSLKGCTYASPVAYDGGDETEVLVATSETLSALSVDGALLWSVTLPARGRS